ncbi:MAG: P-II family nitrogen regulator [Planctomycetaceae bacterium]
MRLIVAVIRPAEVESVRHALAAVQVTRLTVCDAHGYDLAKADPLAQQTMLEIAVNDDFVDRTVTAISDVLAAGHDAESLMYVMPMADAVQLYRGVRGPEAV